MSLGLTENGLHRKYEVRRTDGSSAAGGKHEKCAYFVLDLDHDPLALIALKAYARACRKQNPELASDLERVIATKTQRPTRGNK